MTLRSTTCCAILIRDYIYEYVLVTICSCTIAGNSISAFIGRDAILTQYNVYVTTRRAMSLKSANATGNAAHLILAVTLIGREPSLDRGTPAKPPIRHNDSSHAFLVLSISHDKSRDM